MHQFLDHLAVTCCRGKKMERHWFRLFAAKMWSMVTFLSCLYYCKTAGCSGVIVPQYDARRERDSESGKWKLTCPECGVAHWYDENEAHTDDIPTERLHQLYPERYPN